MTEAELRQKLTETTERLRQRAENMTSEKRKEIISKIETVETRFEELIQKITSQRSD